MPITRTTISLAWLTEQNACNLETLKKYFADRGIDERTEIELTPEGIQRALATGILSCNWLARRILDGAEKEEYEGHMHQAMAEYEKKMAPILAGIIARINKSPSA